MPNEEQLAELYPHSATVLFYNGAKKKVAEIKVRGKSCEELKARMKQMVNFMKEQYNYTYKEA
jgi:hypothetical protein